MSEIDERDIRRICHLYYEEEKTQEKISQIIGVSRFKINRILKQARKNGIVSIVISDPWKDLTEIEMKIVKRFGIQLAILVQINEFGGESHLSQVAKSAADYLRKIVNLHKILGVTWGQTLYQIVNHLKPIQVSDLKLVQIGGSLGAIEGTDNNVLTVRLGQKLGVNAHLIPAPIFFFFL